MKKIYTDGACKNNPGNGGWAFIVVENDLETKNSFGSERNTTNQRMEMTAVIEALESVEGDVEIYSDSAYIINCFTEKWMDKWKKNGWIGSSKKPVSNKDLWERMDNLMSGRNVSFVKVKGHSGDLYNDKVDVLASNAAKKA